MKNLFKRVISIFLIAVLTTASCAMVGAEYVPEDPVEHTSEGPLYRTSSSDSELNTKASRAVGDVLYDNISMIAGVMIRNKATDKGSYYERQKFVRYITASWAKTTEYTFGDSYTVPMQFSGGVTAGVASGVALTLGVSTSYTRPATVTTKLSADVNRDSKLCIVADFLAQKMHCEKWVVGVSKTEDNPNGITYYPTGDTFLRVVYK